MFSQIDQLERSSARTAWRVLEPYHAMISFVPEAREAYASAGLNGYWMGYFASRAAPLGAVPVSVVTATFFNFHPEWLPAPSRIPGVFLAQNECCFRKGQIGGVGKRESMKQMAFIASLFGVAI